MINYTNQPLYTNTFVNFTPYPPYLVPPTPMRQHSTGTKCLTKVFFTQSFFLPFLLLLKTFTQIKMLPPCYLKVSRNVKNPSIC